MVAITGQTFPMTHFVIRKFVCCILTTLLVVSWFVGTGCRPHPSNGETLSESKEPLPVFLVAPPYDTTTSIQAIEAAFGAVERDPQGIVVGVDLALERASATDEVLKIALT